MIGSVAVTLAPHSPVAVTIVERAPPCSGTDAS